jgi:hypothetical protein
MFIIYRFRLFTLPLGDFHRHGPRCGLAHPLPARPCPPAWRPSGVAAPARRPPGAAPDAVAPARSCPARSLVTVVARPRRSPSVCVPSAHFVLTVCRFVCAVML